MKCVRSEPQLPVQFPLWHSRTGMFIQSEFTPTALSHGVPQKSEVEKVQHISSKYNTDPPSIIITITLKETNSQDFKHIGRIHSYSL